MKSLSLKDTLDHLPGSLFITDRESRVLYASAALEQRTGFSVAEIVGKKPGQLWGGKMEKTFYRELWQTIGTERRAFVGLVNNRKKSGARRDEHIFIVPICNRLGETEYFAEIHPDLAGRTAEEAFGREFLRRTETMIQDRDFFTWIIESLQKKKDGTLVRLDQSLWYGGFHDAAQFFRETLVTPMEQVFARRKDDALLITHAQENPEKFAALYQKYVVSIGAYFSRRLHGDSAVAEDLTQEVFVRAFRYLPGFRMTNASYYTYLLRLAHNILVNHFRTLHRQVMSYQHDGEMENFVAKSDHSGEDDMVTLLKTLGEKEKAIMLLKYRDGLKAKEIAALVGKSENAVKLILSRTRKRLKKNLQ
ncbi:MAG: sigma-70 family RNA polymerase sigma factor [Candidatus Moranbacteria bacterium]|nr:sigma-70 family RNA polymerase sigma factor [Candidatus Moranbacteria bacterium]